MKWWIDFQSKSIMRQYRVQTQAKIHVKTSTKNTQTRTKQQWNNEVSETVVPKNGNMSLNLHDFSFFCTQHFWMILFFLFFVWMLTKWGKNHIEIWCTELLKKNQKQRLCMQWFGKEQKKSGVDLLSEIVGDVLWKA